VMSDGPSITSKEPDSGTPFGLIHWSWMDEDYKANSFFVDNAYVVGVILFFDMAHK